MRQFMVVDLKIIFDERSYKSQIEFSLFLFLNFLFFSYLKITKFHNWNAFFSNNCHENMGPSISFKECKKNGVHEEYSKIRACFHRICLFILTIGRNLFYPSSIMQ